MKVGPVVSPFFDHESLTKSRRSIATKSKAFQITSILAFALIVHGTVHCQPFLSRLHATKDSPLYTTYAAAMQRSEFTLDVGYHMVFYDSTRGIEFENQKGGNWSIAFAEMSDGHRANYVSTLPSLYRQPVIMTSYSDIVKYYYYPFKDLEVKSTFLVYSSSTAVQEFLIRNMSNRKRTIQVVPFLSIGKGSYRSILVNKISDEAMFTYVDLPDGWMLDHDMPHVDTVANLFTSSFIPDSTEYSYAERPWNMPSSESDSAKSIAIFKTILIPSHGTVTFRVVRTVARSLSDSAGMRLAAKKAFGLNLDSFIVADQKLYSKIPQLRFTNPDEKMMYWSAFSLLRQCMLPPEGKCHYNYYVFSREPVWGWGHGGQVFHESLSMLAYVYMDPTSAMNSQRVYMERQHPNGYIDYRAGPYLDEAIPYEGQLTTSAPWFSWENWEIFRVTKDKKFLAEAYRSGVKFFDFWRKDRDSQHDSLFEWGGQAVLESVRDADVAVWDQVGWPSNFEGPDLNSMLVMEAKSLSRMAAALGKNREAEKWRQESARLSELINKYMWDDSTGFYYNVNKLNHTFTFKRPDDLKRKEIIGFLPLWAGVASNEQAARLVENLTDTSEFWREYGVPSLAANDPYYNPRGYWNGPVWVEWNYLIEHGLLRYGYRNLARELVEKVTSNVIAQLKKDHYFWEFYDPDARWAGYHKTYIWAGLVARMIMDLRTANGIH